MNNLSSRPRASRGIPVPLVRSSRRYDYRAWAVALFRPEVRRTQDTAELAYLLGDNERALHECRFGAISTEELAELEADITEAWARIAEPQQ